MKTMKLSNKQISESNGAVSPAFPKYTSQLMNLAGGNSQATRPSVVGQMSELFPQFLKECQAPSPDAWRKWYEEKKPEAFNEASKRIKGQIDALKKAIGLIDDKLIRQWAEDLVINKTYNGFLYQKAIIDAIAKEKGLPPRYASPADESKGIDGYIGSEPVSIKPTTYDVKAALPEEIAVRIIRYKKKKTGIEITYDDWQE